jgi:vacuolar-type H+-ATPase catalytic subunit A/Vma1
VSNADWGPGSEVTKMILAEFCGLLAAVQFRLMYPPVSQLKDYSKLYNTRLSEFNP